jgi:hypothetical protein
MELEGRIWKSKRHWLVEVPSLDLMTQGKSRLDALSKIKDAITELLYSYFPGKVSRGFDITIESYEKALIGVSSTDNRLLFSLVLKRQREESQTSVREAADRLGSTSPNAYAQYEKGKINISLDKFEELLQAANPQRRSLLRVI